MRVRQITKVISIVDPQIIALFAFALQCQRAIRLSSEEVAQIIYNLSSIFSAGRAVQFLALLQLFCLNLLVSLKKRQAKIVQSHPLGLWGK